MQLNQQEATITAIPMGLHITTQVTDLQSTRQQAKSDYADHLLWSRQNVSTMTNFMEQRNQSFCSIFPDASLLLV